MHGHRILHAALLFLMLVAGPVVAGDVRPGIGAADVVSIVPPAPGTRYDYTLVDSRIDAVFALAMVRRKGTARSPTYDATLQTKVSPAAADSFERFVRTELGAANMHRQGNIFTFPGAARMDKAFRAHRSSIGFGPEVQYRPNDCSVVIGTCHYTTTSTGQSPQSWTVQTSEKGGVWESLSWQGVSPAAGKMQIRRVFSVDANGITIDEVTDYSDAHGAFRVTITRR